MHKQLKYRNNWEQDIYFAENEKLVDLHRVMIDGTEYPVTSKTIGVSYSDMGKQHKAHSTHYFIKVNILGNLEDIDLNTVVKRKKIFAIDYTTQS